MDPEWAWTLSRRDAHLEVAVRMHPVACCHGCGRNDTFYCVLFRAKIDLGVFRPAEDSTFGTNPLGRVIKHSWPDRRCDVVQHDGDVGQGGSTAQYFGCRFFFIFFKFSSVNTPGTRRYSGVFWSSIPEVHWCTPCCNYL